MISILIPTYNAVCLSLIEKMYKQAIALRIPFEILLADDASCENIRQQNRKMTEWQGCRYLQQEENQGPARIRNYLASEARYPYLLFLDSDVIGFVFGGISASGAYRPGGLWRIHLSA